MSNSFRNPDHDRPQHYQTPSPPPMSYIEPVSPSLLKTSAAVQVTVKKTRKRKNAEPAEAKVRKRRVTQRPRAQKAAKKQDESAMDAFATIALSMGLDTEYRQTPAQYSAPPQSSTTNFPQHYNHAEHDPKRVKHERSTSLQYPAVSWHTSPPTAAQRSDAELLLNFSRNASTIFRPKTSTAVYHHHSPLQSNQPYAPPSHHSQFEPMATHNYGQNYPQHNGAHFSPTSYSDPRLEDTTYQRKYEPNHYSHDNNHFPNSTVPDVPDVPARFPSQASHYNQQYHHTLPIPPPAQPHYTSNQNHVQEHGNKVNGFYPHTSQPASASVLEPVHANDLTSDVPLSKSATKMAKSEPLTICGYCNLSDQDGEQTSWINCDACKEWVHTSCAGFSSARELRSVDKYRCNKCKPVHGPTTLVRKSTRAHTSIDYAGLNDGILKTSDEETEHHYIKPIKEGGIQFTPHEFVQMRPEEVTAEFFRNGDGMSQPFLIPAAWNPRPGVLRQEADMTVDSEVRPSITENGSGEVSKLIAEQPDGLGMIIPSDLTVQRVADLYGPDEKIEVIDVKTQNGEDRKWTLKRWVDYYESTGVKKVRNVISLEVSQSALAQLLERPKVVRDLDLQDAVWPKDLLARGEYPHVQYYCLMSVADCYTDFHIDFGGSSVFYHVIRGRKTFFFIPPTEKHLKQYEEWCNSPSQNWTFLGDTCGECYRLDLSAGDTAFIPAGWIHAVWTPEDSLVIGGNFLSSLHYGMQLRVNNIEKATGVGRKFRYPSFQKLMWYVALDYMKEDPTPASVETSLLEKKPLHNGTIESADAVSEQAQPERIDQKKPRQYAKHEIAGLPELLKYLHRTVLISTGTISDGVTDDTKSAVTRAIPKGYGTPTDLIRKFAIWCSWKRDEPLPEWVFASHAAKLAAENSTVGGRGIKRAAKTKADRPSARDKRAKTSPTSSSRPSTAKDENIKQEPVLDNHDVQSLPVASLNESTLAQVNESNQARLSHDGMDIDGSNSRTAHLEAAPLPSVESPQDDIAFKDETLLDAVNDLLVAREEAESMNHELEPVSLLPDPQPEFQAPIVPTSLPDQPLYSLTSSTVPTSKLKAHGRSKACKDCRRSKRRCVHDENGQTDPAKVAEAIQPRAGARKKNLDSLGIARVDSGSPKSSESVVTPLTGSESHKSSIDSTADDTKTDVPSALTFPNPKPLSPPESTLAEGFSPAMTTDDKSSAQAATQIQKPIFTPEPDDSRRQSSSSANANTTTNINMNEAVITSPTSPTSPAQKFSRRGSKARLSDIEADSESLKLMRELAAQDMGLRVRA